MATEARIEANRRNAQKSTGPRTSSGKALACYNAVRHGVLTAAPVLPGEDIAAWDQHKAGVAESLAPVGALERALADRVALTLWRLERFARAEALATAAALAEAVLPKAPGIATDIFHPAPDTSLMAVKVAARKLARLKARHAKAVKVADCLEALESAADGDPLPDAAEAARAVQRLAGRYKWKGPKPPRDARKLAGLADGEPWTAGHLRGAVTALAAGVEGTPDWLAAGALSRLLRRCELLAADREDARAYLGGLAERTRTASARKAAATLLPRADKGDLMIRYESHLQKLLTTTLHELERLQALRAGRAVVPPLAVDVTVIGPDIASAD